MQARQVFGNREDLFIGQPAAGVAHGAVAIVGARTAAKCLQLPGRVSGPLSRQRRKAGHGIAGAVRPVTGDARRDAGILITAPVNALVVVSSVIALSATSVVKTDVPLTVNAAV